MVGELYKYPNDDKLFKLKEIRRYTYIFECGHWCIDTVFADLINVRTGIQNHLIERDDTRQFKLF